MKNQKATVYTDDSHQSIEFIGTVVRQGLVENKIIIYIVTDPEDREWQIDESRIKLNDIGE